MQPNKVGLWLGRFLLGESPADEAGWLQFADECPSEGLQLEFKSGRELEKEDAALELEKYVAGFANSEGGILLFGYNEAARTYDGYHCPGRSPEEWAARVLQQRVSPYLSIQPRVATGIVQGQPVFAVAVARAAGLVPVSRRGRLVIFLRVGDSTVKQPEYRTVGAPEYLAGDLILGRRAVPDVRLAVRNAIFEWRESDHSRDEGVTTLRIEVGAENVGLLFAESVRFGLVAWTKDSRNLDGLVPGSSVPERLRMGIDAPQPPADPRGGTWHLRHFHSYGPGGIAPVLGPFEMSQSVHLGRISVPWVPKGQSAVIRAGLYVLSRNTEPRWHQFQLTYDSTVPWMGGIVDQPATDRCVLDVGVPRPEVAWTTK